MNARTKALAAAIAVLSSGSALAGCTHSATGTGAAPAAAPRSSPTHTGSAAALSSSAPRSSAARRAPRRPSVDPLTGGKPSSRPVVAVKIDDTVNGRPQRGITAADLVYIEQVEGGLTRLVAVFHTSLPNVEPVRSTRANDPELLAQFGPIGYVASGGAANPLKVLRQSTLRASATDAGAGLSRDYGRGAPYNLVADLSTLAKTLRAPAAKSIGLTWSAASRQAAAAPRADSVRATVGATPVEFRWQAALHRYVRFIGGVEQHAANGAPISTPNVIVQSCRVTTYWKDVDVNHHPAKWSHTVGRGRVTVFRNGRKITGTWSRPTLGSGTTLRDAHGTPIALAPGGAWVVLVANGTPVR